MSETMCSKTEYVNCPVCKEKVRKSSWRYRIPGDERQYCSICWRPLFYGPNPIPKWSLLDYEPRPALTLPLMAMLSTQTALKLEREQS